MQSTAQTTKEIIYVGTYSERGSKGIYVFDFDREEGKLTEIQTLTDREHPTYLDIHPNGRFLYSGNRQGTSDQPDEGSVSAYSIDPKSGKLETLGTVSSAGFSPAHISVDPQGKLLYVSHYASSHMSVFTIEDDGKIGDLIHNHQYTGKGVNPERQKESHLHSIVPDPSGKYIYASDLGTDKIHPFEISEQNKKPVLISLEAVDAKPGSGPRHFIFHPNGNLAFSVEELSSTLTAYAYNSSDGKLTFIAREEMVLPSDNYAGNNTAADLQVSPDGKFIYASNRGLDNIVVFEIDQSTGKMKYAGSESSGGAHPRTFAMDQKGDYLFVTNMHTDNLVLLRRDKITGLLVHSGIEAKVPAAAAVKHMILKY